MYNIYEYIDGHDFVKALPQHITYLILTDHNLGLNTQHIHRCSFSDFLRNPGIYQNKKDRIIALSYHLTSKDIIMISSILRIPHHWISLHPGLSSLIHKYMPEENDITTMHYAGYKVQEPYDYECLISTLQDNKNSYNRVHITPLPSTLHNSTHKSDTSIFISGSHHTSELTVITLPSSVDKVAQGIHTYTQGSSHILDLYVRYNMHDKRDSSLIESIQKTQRVLYIIDHKATEEICSFLSEQVFMYCDKNTSLHYMFPQYHLVQNILSDYQEQEAHFDHDAIVHFLSSLLQK